MTVEVNITSITGSGAADPLDEARINPRVHLIVGAQFGDLEVDIGKSVYWASQFATNTFIADTYLNGNPRYWVIDWQSNNTRKVKTKSLLNTYFTAPAAWREAQFAAADQAWGYADNDWVLFVDATEGLCVDENHPPDDEAASPYKAYIDREIQRAKDINETSVCLPFFVFSRNDTVHNIRYRYLPEEVVAAADTADDPLFGYADYAVGTNWYYPIDGLYRLFRVSTLRETGFDWSCIDQYSTPSANVKIQIISYAYANWRPKDFDINNDNVYEQDDIGSQMRNLISQVRPLPGTLPVEKYGPSITSDGVTITEVDGEDEAAVLTTPLYPTIFRNNFRDGVQYLNDAYGNVPLVWDPDNSEWIPAVDPYRWKGIPAQSTLFNQE